MSRPRQILPGSYYLLTRRTTQRQLWLRPDPEVNNILQYCMAEATERFPVDVLMPSMMGNHHHTAFHDPIGHAPLWYEHFHKMSAKALNVYRGRSENLWKSGPPSLLQLESPDDVIEKMVYAAINPVRHGLVEKVSDWPGWNGLEAFLKQEAIVAHRPRQFFAKDSAMPETATLELVIPPGLGDPDKIRAIVERRVAEAEAEYAEERKQSGRRVVGVRRIRTEPCTTIPSTPEPARRLNPRIAARSRRLLLDAIGRMKAFEADYAKARHAWMRGDHDVDFPFGTFWLRRYANVRVGPRPQKI